MVPLLAACATGPGDRVLDVVYDPCEPVMVSLDDTAPASAAADLTAAIDMWRSVGTFRMTDEPGADAPVLPVQFESAAPFFHGVYDDERGIVIINLNLSPGHDTAVTLAHELGHAFGLWHAPGSTPSVMIEGNLSIEPTDEDAGHLAELWGRCDRTAP